MALSVVVRAGVSSLRREAGRNFLTPPAVLRPLVAGIVSKTLRPRDYKRPPPFPYKKYKYGLFQSLVNKTLYRLDENSKIIVVDGPIAVGKTKFAKEIADELDMLYMPMANMDMMLINSYGFDMRQLDPQMPPSVKSFDENNFLRNPNHPNVAAFQLNMFRLRLEQYIDALGHLLSTGQGVVMDRSVYSDFVFIETMTQFGYVSKAVRDYYYECYKVTVTELMKPHLVIYLDCPPKVVMQHIKARAHPHEVTSPVLTEEYLAYMEKVYKQQFLKQISTHAELLIYDWSEEGEPEVVVEDIERIHFTTDKHDPKMDDWKLRDEDAWGEKRMLYTKGRHWFLQWFEVPDYSIPELVVVAEDFNVFQDVWDNAPGNKYAKGFNADMGDLHIATKFKPELYR